MRYGFVGYKGILEDIDYAVQYGLDHIEFDLTKISLKVIDKEIHRIKNCGKTISFHLPWDYSFNPQKGEDFDYFINVANLANKVNAEYLVMHLGYYEMGERRDYLDNSISFVKKAFGLNLKSSLLIENLKPKSQISNKIFLGGDMDDFDRIFAEIKNEQLKMCYDIGHAAYHWNIQDTMVHLKDKIYSIHLHDNNGTKDHISIGTGNIDWKSTTKLIKQLNLKGPIIFEIFDVPFHRSLEQFQELI